MCYCFVHSTFCQHIANSHPSMRLHIENQDQLLKILLCLSSPFSMAFALELVLFCIKPYICPWSCMKVALYHVAKGLDQYLNWKVNYQMCSFFKPTRGQILHWCKSAPAAALTQWLTSSPLSTSGSSLQPLQSFLLVFPSLSPVYQIPLPLNFGMLRSDFFSKPPSMGNFLFSTFCVTPESKKGKKENEQWHSHLPIMAATK